MYLPPVHQDSYVTDAQRHQKYRSRKVFKGPFWFYPRYGLLIMWSGIKFLFTRDPQAAVSLQGRRVMSIAERHGAHFTCEGMENLSKVQGPFVFACNHMSTLEVNALPGIIAYRMPIAFVVKKSLMKIPFLSGVLKRLDCITVERKHPGEDLMQVLKQGEELLRKGTSVILFPESTRQDVFHPGKFNSLAIKLALKANVPVIPVALKTDFWGSGKMIKDFGPLDENKPVHIRFGEPLVPSGRGKAEHQKAVEFIRSHLEEWGVPILGSE
ncbi:MAG: 1-acyl-sn-glycerol-3-phosphate acyltransferase [Spirochaetales bacterium]|nr:1-acyl-sn-glycerol-3-phosphate acyltransferase [Spirochaetales bacterium]